MLNTPSTLRSRDSDAKSSLAHRRHGKAPSEVAVLGHEAVSEEDILKFAAASNRGKKVSGARQRKVKDPFVYDWAEDLMLMAVGLVAIAIVVFLAVHTKNTVYPPQTLTAPVDKAGSTPADRLHAFNYWLQVSNNVKIDGTLRILDVPSSITTTTLDRAKGRHIIAARSLSTHETVLKVPTHLCITVADTRRPGSGLRDAFPSLRNVYELDAEHVLALRLLHERQLGAASKYAPWIAVLPKTLTNGLSLSEDDKLCMCTDGRARAAALFDKYRELLDIVGAVSRRSNYFLNKTISDADVRWALEIVHSRGLSSKHLHGSRHGDDFMCPGVDMFNHHSGKGAVFGFAKESQSVEVQLTAPSGPGDEVYLDYRNGIPRGPVETFVQYGFVDEHAIVVESFYDMQTKKSNAPELSSAFTAVDDELHCNDPNTLLLRHTGEATASMYRCVAADVILGGDLEPTLSAQTVSSADRIKLLNSYLSGTLEQRLLSRLSKLTAGRIHLHASDVIDEFPSSSAPHCAHARSEVHRLNKVMRDVMAKAGTKYRALSSN
eukprot:PhM_4_TR14271/c0_g1_i2/m.4901